MDLLCGLVRVYSTMVSAASLKVMNFYDDMGRFKFLIAVLFVNFIFLGKRVLPWQNALTNKRLSTTDESESLISARYMGNKHATNSKNQTLIKRKTNQSYDLPN